MVLREPHRSMEQEREPRNKSRKIHPTDFDKDAKQFSEGKIACSINGDKGDLTLGGERTIQHTDDVLQNCTSETYIILLINVTPINSIKSFLKMQELTTAYI